MIYIMIIVAIVFAETMIKNYMDKNKTLGRKEKILNGEIIINKHYNCGMILNYLENKKEMVKTVSVAVLGALLLLFAILVPRKGNRLFKLGLSIALGGAISNVMDRVTRGYVIDYFSFKRYQKVVFNLADMFIALGSIIMLIASLFVKVESCADEPFE